MMKTTTKKKSNAWLQKNSELTTYIISNIQLDGSLMKQEVLDKIDQLQSELEKL